MAAWGIGLVVVVGAAVIGGGYDAGGRARDVVVTYGRLEGRPPTGEDGLMGGIPFGTNFAPSDADAGAGAGAS